jgi:Tol biopolymer transport system component
VPPQGVQFTRTTNDTVAVISPDGRRVAFIAQRLGVGAYELWVRSLDTLEARPLPGTELASLPFWSPDSRMLGFFAFGKLKIVDASGGPVQTLCDTTGLGGTWNNDGTIVFSSGNVGRGNLSRISATGGTPTPLPVSEALGTTIPRYPSFLPDGRRFLYYASPSSSIWIASLDSVETRRLTEADSQAQYADGHLLFVRQGALLEQTFDAENASLSGDPRPITEQVYPDPMGYAPFSASANNTLAYRMGTLNTRTQLTWVDRSGALIGTVGPPGLYRNPALSPDGTRLAVEETDPERRSQDIWLFDIGRDVRSRFTFDPRNDIYPVWSPDGTRIVFASDRAGNTFNLFQKPATGASDEQLVAEGLDPMAAPYSWSPDGRYLVHRSGTTSTAVLTLDNPPKSQPLFASDRFIQVYAQISPDGRWIAYTSNESGRNEVLVRSFPSADAKWQVSQNGGGFARWRGDGRELFFYAADGRLYAVPVDTKAVFRMGTPTPLFEARMLNGPNNGVGLRQQYDVSRDGQRFLLNVTADDTLPSPITIVLNWATASAR